MKILFVVLLLTNVIGPSYAQQLVEFKLFHKQADIEAYLKSLCKTADWEVDSIKKKFEAGTLLEWVSLPLIEKKVYSSLITVHFVYAPNLKSYICDVMAITVENEHLPEYLSLFNKKYKKLKDHWEFDTGQSFTNKHIYYSFEFELGPNDHTPIGYSLIRGKVILK